MIWMTDYLTELRTMAQFTMAIMLILLMIILSITAVGERLKFTGSPGELLATIQLSHAYTHNNIAFMEEGKVLISRNTTGRLSKIDYFERSIILNSQVRLYLAIAYDCLNQVVLTLESDKKSRTYIMDITPNSLTNSTLIQPPITFIHLWVGLSKPD